MDYLKKTNPMMYAHALRVQRMAEAVEAALALARLKFRTIMFTVAVDSIALMPCNPNTFEIS